MRSTLPTQVLVEDQLSAEGTTWAINELVGLLSDIRSRSDPSIFEEKWNAEIGHVYDLEQINHDDEEEQEPETETETDNMTATSEVEAEQTSITADLSSASPTASTRNNKKHRPQVSARSYMTPTPTAQPSPTPVSHQNLHRNVRNTPSVPHTHVTVQISTSDRPPSTTQSHPHPQPYYTWPGAPCSASDRAAFFAGITARVHLRPAQIKGYALSFSWCDISLWMENSLDDMERGWEGVQRVLTILNESSNEDGASAWKEVSVRVLVLRK